MSCITESGDAANAPKQRRSRWGTKADNLPSQPAILTQADNADGSRKRSRWGGKKEEPADPLLMAVQMGIPLATLQHMSAKQQESLPQLKQRVDEIDLLLRLPDCGVSEIPPGHRSPSPDPIFDRSGTRVNSREARRRQALEKERVDIIETLKPRQPGQRQWRKIIVPVEKYPGYNFFGALIGPRGNAQKRMERESGCKIVIRGKGAIKDGCGRHDGRPLGPEDEEPMHVLIEGPDEETVERGQKIVEVVLNPYSEDAVAAKEKQMRELAILNGTLKDEDNSVANWGNRAQQGALFPGSRGLPPPPSGTLPLPPSGSSGLMDHEYANFMAELGGPPSVAAQRDSSCKIDKETVLAAAPWLKPESEGGIGSSVPREVMPPLPPPPPDAPLSIWAAIPPPQGGLPQTHPNGCSSGSRAIPPLSGLPRPLSFPPPPGMPFAPPPPSPYAMPPPGEPMAENPPPPPPEDAMSPPLDDEAPPPPPPPLPLPE